MPLIPPSAKPDLPDALSGGTWINTGGATSGTLSAVDYAYYTQTLEIDYVRKPTSHTTNGATFAFSLSSTSGIEYVQTTELHTIVKAKNSCKKIQQAPGTVSGYTQSQKFSIFAVSSDQYDNSCGDPSVSSFIFGPRGKVYTTQPWIWMTPWVTARDKEYNVQTVGTNKNLSLSTNGTNYWKVSNISDPFPWYSWNETINDAWYGNEINYQNTSNKGEFRMYGAYSVSSEPALTSSALGLDNLIAFIEENCDSLAYPQYYSRFGVLKPLFSDGYQWVQEKDRVPQNTHYSSGGRHEYS